MHCEITILRWRMHRPPPWLSRQKFRLSCFVSDRHPTATVTPITLSHVCSRWRAICLSLPDLWTSPKSLSNHKGMSEEFFPRSSPLLAHLSPNRDGARSKLISNFMNTMLTGSNLYIFPLDCPMNLLVFSRVASNITRQWRESWRCV